MIGGVTIVCRRRHVESCRICRAVGTRGMRQAVVPLALSSTSISSLKNRVVRHGKVNWNETLIYHYYPIAKSRSNGTVTKYL